MDLHVFLLSLIETFNLHMYLLFKYWELLNPFHQICNFYEKNYTKWFYII